MSETKEMVLWIVGITLAVVGTFALLLVPMYFIDRANCNRISSDSQIRTEFRLLGGCYVEVNGRLIPKENWRGEYEQE